MPLNAADDEPPRAEEGPPPASPRARQVAALAFRLGARCPYARVGAFLGISDRSVRRDLEHAPSRPPDTRAQLEEACTLIAASAERGSEPDERAAALAWLEHGRVQAVVSQTPAPTALSRPSEAGHVVEAAGRPPSGDDGGDQVERGAGTERDGDQGDDGASASTSIRPGSSVPSLRCHNAPETPEGAALMLERSRLAQRGRRLEYFTILWNSLEGLIAVVAGALAGSISLVGFGVDSFIEVTSGTALWWRMATDADEAHRERRERLTLRIVGASFLALAGYVAFEAIRDLATRSEPEVSRIGIALACVSLVVMPVLARKKREVGRALGSRAMDADATQTDFCTYLSAILLAGLLLNAVGGWWWADPVAALVMVPVIAKEGIEGLRGDPCCDKTSHPGDSRCGR